MQEMIKKNHEQANREYKEKVRRYIELKKKQEKRDRVLGYLIAAFIITITCVCIALIDKQNKSFIDTCTSKGYSVNYCMNHM